MANEIEINDAINKITSLKQDYVDVFEGEAGKRVLDDLAKRCFIFKSTLDKDTNRMAFNEGQRSIVLHIQNTLKIDIEKTKKFMLEQNKEGADNVQ